MDGRLSDRETLARVPSRGCDVCCKWTRNGDEKEMNNADKNQKSFANIDVYTGAQQRALTSDDVLASCSTATHRLRRTAKAITGIV
jgi:hypothetical protein